MRKHILICLLVGMFLFTVEQSFAQTNSTSEQEAVNAPVSAKTTYQPIPKQARVQHAPNAIKPSLGDDIKSIKKQLKVLNSIPTAKRPVFLNDKIKRLEKTLAEKETLQKKKQSKSQ